MGNWYYAFNNGLMESGFSCKDEAIETGLFLIKEAQANKGLSKRKPSNIVYLHIGKWSDDKMDIETRETIEVILTKGE